MKGGRELFFDSDVVAEHLSGSRNGISLLLRCLAEYDNCYTSVFNLAEIFSSCSTPSMISKAKRSITGVNLLGMPYRYSEKLGKALGYCLKNGEGSYRDALVVTMCSETKLPLLTFDKERYLSLSRKFGVKLFDRKAIERTLAKNYFQ